MARVVLAQEEDSRCVPLVHALHREGYQIQVCHDGPAALHAALHQGVDLLMVDLGRHGLEVCQRLRAAGHALPVLILGPRAAEADTVAALDVGADDYVAKPFRLAELLARIRALLRRGGDHAGVCVQGVRLDRYARRAWLGPDELQLSLKEFELLRVLVREAGQVVTREQLMREVWDTTWWSSTKTLDMHISLLRKKLGDPAPHPRFITTVRGVGFRFERA
jgi:DNA-binding response OmpR family regulator